VPFVLFGCETSFSKFRGELKAEDGIWVSEEGSKRRLEETVQLEASWSVRLRKYYPGDKKIEMGEAFGTYEGEERFMYGFGGKAGGKEATWKT